MKHQPSTFVQACSQSAMRDRELIVIQDLPGYPMLLFSGITRHVFDGGTGHVELTAESCIAFQIGEYGFPEKLGDEIPVGSFPLESICLPSPATDEYLFEEGQIWDEVM